MPELDAHALLLRSTPLPWDVLYLVLQACDPSTLVILGRVSLDLLSIVGPLLYTHVEITSLNQLEALFYDDGHGVVLPQLDCEQPFVLNFTRINPFLSLTQTRTLSLNLTSHTPNRDHPIPSLAALSFSRLPSSDSLPLDLFRLSVNIPNNGNSYFHTPNIFTSLFASFLPHFNPRRCDYYIPPLPHADLCTRVLAFRPEPEPLLQSWTRLELLELKGVLPFAWVGLKKHFGGLPSSSRGLVRLHLEMLAIRERGKGYAEVLSELQVELRYEWATMEEGSVVLVVRNEGEEKEAEKAVGAMKGGRVFNVQLEG